MTIMGIDWERTWMVNEKTESEIGKLPAVEGLITGKHPVAELGVNIGYSLDYGRGKCSVTIQLQCDQTYDKIEEAEKIALALAEKYADDGMSNYVIPRLQTVET